MAGFRKTHTSPDPLHQRHAWHDTLRLRIILCAALLLLLLMLLLLRLWQVQVIQGQELNRRTLQQSIRPLRLNATRGNIIAQDGTVLVHNINRYDLVAYVSEMRQPGKYRNTLDHILEQEKYLAFTMGRQSTINREILRRHLRLAPVLPLVLARNLTPAEVAKVAELMPPVPGITTLPRPERTYAFPGLACHALGFTAWGRPDDLDSIEDFTRIYTFNELRGRTGLEASYEDTLAGKSGSRLLTVDSLGFARDDVRPPIEPTDGANLQLSLDHHAQQAAERTLHGYHGALVVVAARSGAVIALASTPGYDPAALTAASYTRLAGNQTDKPLLNRAVNGSYTPGSIIKPLIALAALENGTLTPQDYYECDGQFWIANHRIRCAKRAGHGLLHLHEALAFSCNPFFLDAGCRTGIDRLQIFFSSAGFGTPCGLDLAEFEPGIIPSRDFARNRWQRSWLAVDTAYVAIGQGALTITPLQAALYAAALGNGGKVFRPYLVQAVRSPSGETLTYTAPVIRRRLPVSHEHLQLVRQGMQAAVNTPGASASGLQRLNLPIAAKTGTAEVGSGDERYKNTWVIAFWPADNPDYALAALIEDGDTGGRTTIPAVARFLQEWLRLPPSSSQPQSNHP